MDNSTATPDAARLAIADHSERKRYELEVDGQLAGFIDYRSAGNRLHLIHTEVLPGHEGMGLGALLARHALDDARRQGRRVAADCSFIAAFARRHPDYADVVA